MDQNGKDDLKTQFVTREGTYRLMTLSEYSRPNRVGYQSNQNNPQVRVSLITLPAPSSTQVTGAPTATTGCVGLTSTGAQESRFVHVLIEVVIVLMGMCCNCFGYRSRAADLVNEPN